jgi:hypothetical protein
MRFSWNSHAIITALSLESLPRKYLEGKIEAVGSKEINNIIYEYVTTHQKESYPLSDSLSINQQPENLAALLRVNPQTEFHITKLSSLPEMSFDHDNHRFGPPEGSSYLPAQNQLFTPYEILVTYSDEPDWGMDQDLFAIERYGYAPCPFGVAHGPSSQAPFHMAFFHLHPIAKFLMPGLSRSFLLQRVEMCIALSEFAFARNQDFWGYRFLAWSIHYFQDLTQPYHSKPFPPSISASIVNFAKKPKFRNFVARNKYLLTNKHYVFEFIIHWILNDAFWNNREHPFAIAMRSNDEPLYGELSAMCALISKTPAKLATRIDELLSIILRSVDFSDPLLVSDEYLHEKFREAFLSIDKSTVAATSPFVQYVSACLRETGRITRYIIKRQVDKLNRLFS